MAEENLLHVNDDDFEEKIIKSELPVLVDFWAAWCGPCKAIAPTIEALAGEYAGKVRVAKVDVDSNPKTASNYAIRAIPTMILFKDGEVADQITGAVGKSKLEEAIKKVLS
ncbi:MAG: thioredoxin [Deltaproteobacteria bacterium]|nr:thioredoxin [Deltaproteobacteria bacterium]MBW2053531.1 thioredoxin [Deltaproteobacteria bacterium]MBW2142012.1 thioredoxin [Deltaproteobacteria bacterium]MBW2324786.1 thioredoxin [Deltaproteobacteria bacterium]